MTDRISLLIQAKNLSAAQFADEIGVQRSSISHLMSGRNKPSLDLIQKTLQRFPEVSTEWLLMGKGEMVKELNLFEAQARSGGMQAAVKQAPEYGQLFQNLEREPTLFGSELPENTMETEVQDDINSTVEPVAVKARIAMPVPEPEENIRASGIRKESGEDSLKVSNKKSSKKECAIDQIIVFYDDRTFIAYSPGN